MDVLNEAQTRRFAKKVSHLCDVYPLVITLPSHDVAQLLEVLLDVVYPQS